MINLLRGELYKLFKSKSLYICSVVMIVFVLLIYGMFSLADMIQQGEITNGSYGITVNGEGQGDVNVWGDMQIPVILQMMFSSIVTVIIAIFVAIYAFGDYANGAIKNVVGKGYGRWNVFIAKCISAVIGAAVIEFIMLLALILCEVFILDASRINADFLVELCGYVGMQLLLTAALTGLMVMINQICRNLGAGIAISVCMIMFSSFITTGLNAVLSYLKIDVNVCDYWVLDLISNCPVTDMDGSFLLRAVTCAVVWLVLALGIGGMHFRKADVK